MGKRGRGAMLSAPIDGVVCHCGNARRWRDTTDPNTGVSYMVCRGCGRQHVLNSNWWLDKSLGMFIPHEFGVGSWATFTIAEDFIVQHVSTDSES